MKQIDREMAEAEAGNFTPQPATGNEAEKLANMIARTKTLLEVLEAESSGVRDGAGFWIGCDPIADLLEDLSKVYQMSADEIQGGKHLPF